MVEPKDFAFAQSTSATVTRALQKVRLFWRFYGVDNA
uniref:Uncharacterized protein n=1 Tax=Peronospora matthiolae TaxID=2874970 RepID=A0AAV1UK62_9STRA